MKKFIKQLKERNPFHKQEQPQELPIKRTLSSNGSVQFATSYTLGRTIGKGAFGIVYEATHNSSHKKYAIKSLVKSNLSETQKVKQEIQILKSISHPNIVQFYELFEDDVHLRIVSELCSGGELFDRIIKQGSFTEKDAIHLIKQLLSGVCYLHSKNIVHRDLKPENLLFNVATSQLEDCKLMITDFGLSRISDEDLLMTACGTPSFVAPEVIMRTGHGTPCDLWSIKLNITIL